MMLSDRQFETLEAQRVRLEIVNFARYGAHRARELALYPALLRRSPKGCVLVFQPHGRFGGSLLRGYEVAHTLNQRGWRAVVVPLQLELAQRQRLLRVFKPDIALLLKSRDPRNSHALLADVPYVYDLDDADFHDPKLTARMEQDVSHAVGVIAGSRYVGAWCAQHNPNTTVIWTGARPQLDSAPDHARRGQVVAWAQSEPQNYLPEFDWVVQVMERLAETHQGLCLRLYGDAEAQDGGRSARLRAKGITVDWQPFLQYDAFLRSLCDVAVGFAPINVQSLFGRGKSFGKVLAYLDARVPIVASDKADHAALFEPGSGVVSNDPEVWVAETSVLLASAERRTEMARRAYDIYQRKLTLEAATDRVEAFLRKCLAERQPSPATQVCG